MAQHKDSSAVPAFIAKIPDPPNDRYNAKTIDVGSFAALYTHLGSNRTLRLTGDIIIPEAWPDKSNVNLELNRGFTVRGLSNLKIVSAPGKKARIIQPNRVFKVAEFYKCENVHFDNIIAGHEPEKGTCAASVFIFTECTDIFIDNSTLYGSGYEGITAFKTTNLNCRKTTIRECSFRIMSISQSENIRFAGCTFTENNEPEGSGKLYLAGTERLLFDRCVFSHNAAYSGEPGEEPFFKIQECMDVYVNECTFANNKAKYFVLNEKDIHLIDPKNENNTWDNPEPAAL